MGKRRKPKANGENSEDSWFRPPIRKELLNYLCIYKQECNLFYESFLRHSFDGSTQPLLENRFARTAVIGGVEMPPLNRFDQPYLEVDTNLNSKQRKILHECCVEVDLFHDTYGEKGNRKLVISLYADGFATIPGLQQPETPQWSALRYQSWCCRESVRRLPDASTTTTIGREALSRLVTPLKSNVTMTTDETYQQQLQDQRTTEIYSLIDQPGDCIRDHEILIPSDLQTTKLVDESLEVVLVDTVTKLHACVEDLQEVDCLAFDVEAYNASKYAQLTCLLQLATSARIYIIDPLADGVWTSLEALQEIFADPTIVKIGHAIGGLDIRCLHRDFGIFLVNVFDTYEAAQLLHLDSHGLAAVCAQYGMAESEHYHSLKQDYQTCDWRERPLTGGMMEYAKYDVQYLIQLRQLMMRDLVARSGPDLTLEEGRAIRSFHQDMVQIEMEEDGETDKEVLEQAKRNIFNLDTDDVDDDDAATFKTSRQQSTDELAFLTPCNSKTDLDYSDDEDDNGNDDDVLRAPQLRLQPLLMACLAASQERCRELWSSAPEPHLKNDVFLNFLKRSRQEQTFWSPLSTELYSGLVEWRSNVAKELQVLPSLLVSLDFLVCVAWKRPTTEFKLRLIRYQLPEILQKQTYQEQLLDIVLRKTLEEGESIAAVPKLLYADLNYMPNKRRSFLRNGTREEVSNETIAFQFAIGAILCTGIVLSIMEGVKRYRK